MLKLQFHSDPGHGWLMVHEDDVIAQGMKPSDFTSCSYRSRDGVLALEEDCDAGKFLEHLTAKGVPFQIKHTQTNSQALLRRWPSIGG